MAAIAGGAKLSASAPPAASHVVHVAVHTPAYSSVAGLLSYASARPLAAGTVVRVPLGRREVAGVVWDAPQQPQQALPDTVQLRPVADVLDGIAPLGAHWRALVAFAARYYQRSIGEVASSALPQALRTLRGAQLARRLQLAAKKARAHSIPAAPDAVRPLSAEQHQVCAQIASGSGPFLLHGSTGSGKTEVYLHAVRNMLAASAQAQALVLVPEINLTPQLQARFAARFAHLLATQCGAHGIVSLHSGMGEAQRFANWLAAHSGTARIVLGTRMAIFASLPHLALIVVDEEHDASYKQQEGARYSARDLAVWRARAAGAKIILGSATPSLESWHASRPAAQGGRYQRLHMPARIGAAQLPALRLVDMRQQPRGALFAAPLLAAMAQRVQRGEQSLVLLNRRGFAPVLHCPACDWHSDCPHCSAYRVFHKSDRSLRCHHCGYSERVPRACPTCGNPDLLPHGSGTEQLQEALERALRNVQRPDRQAARVARIDADTTRARGALAQQLAHMHAGEIDVLVGTQMIAKGHDFRRITLVAAVQPDNALFSSDYRAPERLFALLMQAAGRAGRDAQYMDSVPGRRAEMWLQTREPQHSVYRALGAHDWTAFADAQLHERQNAALPPFTGQALLRADARSQEAAQAFLHAAHAAARANTLAQIDQVTIYPPIPLTIARVANVERAQMLLEAPTRAALQQLLRAWHPLLHQLRAQAEHRGVLRWLIDVDPVAI